jgi:hypothetical protein
MIAGAPRGLRLLFLPYFLDSLGYEALKPLYFQHILMRAVSRLRGYFMFRNLFDFSKTRTLKESIGFYVFYTTIALALTGLAGLFA